MTLELLHASLGTHVTCTTTHLVRVLNYEVCKYSNADNPWKYNHEKAGIVLALKFTYVCTYVYNLKFSTYM